MDLTPKQRDVLQWLIKGKTNGEIADILGLTRTQVEGRVHKIYARLGVPNRVSALIKVLKGD